MHFFGIAELCRLVGGKSPLFHDGNSSNPCLSCGAAMIRRGVQVESDEIVETVRKNGIPVEYLVFPDEGHGFSKGENRIAASKAIVSFLNTCL